MQQIQNAINTTEDIRKERLAREELEELLNSEELLWAQKARSKWILKGDKNTKYFQIVVKQRRGKYRILQIRDEQGNLTDNFEEVEAIFSNHFKRNYEGISNRSVNDIV